MPPNNSSEQISAVTEIPSAPDVKASEDFKPEYIPSHVLLYVYVHLASLYGLYVLPDAKWGTIFFAVFLYNVGILGLTAGKHRFWSHKAYKAKLPLQILMAFMTSVDFQFSILTWVRDHRSHHKFCETDADPYNPKRGLLFAHAGWLLEKKHPEVKRRGKGIDMSDMYANPVVMFQHKNFLLCGGLACFVMPTLLPTLWGESLIYAWHINVLRYALSMHAGSLVNSYSHLYGFRPYDKNISATESFSVSALSAGEGFHNFHHVFPADYRSAEIGKFNVAASFIDFFAKIGWAYDLKTITEEMIRERQARTGDGTDLWGNALEKNM